MNKNFVIGKWEVLIEEEGQNTIVRSYLKDKGKTIIYFCDYFDKEITGDEEFIRNLIVNYVRKVIISEEDLRINESIVNCVLADTEVSTSSEFIEKYNIPNKYKDMIFLIYKHTGEGTLTQRYFMKTVSSWQEALKELCSIDSVRQSILHNKYLLFDDIELEELSYAQVIALLCINADGPSSNPEIRETIYNGYNIDSHLQMDREGRINYTTAGGLEFGVKKVWIRNVESDNSDFIVVIKNPGPGFPDSTLRKKLESEGWEDTHKTIWDF